MFRIKYGIYGAVGIIDGTPAIFSQKPAIDGDTYFSFSDASARVCRGELLLFVIEMKKICAKKKQAWGAGFAFAIREFLLGGRKVVSKGFIRNAFSIVRLTVSYIIINMKPFLALLSRTLDLQGQDAISSLLCTS